MKYSNNRVTVGKNAYLHYIMLQENARPSQLVDLASLRNDMVNRKNPCSSIAGKKKKCCAALGPSHADHIGGRMLVWFNYRGSGATANFPSRHGRFVYLFP